MTGQPDEHLSPSPAGEADSKPVPEESDSGYADSAGPSDPFAETAAHTPRAVPDRDDVEPEFASSSSHPADPESADNPDAVPETFGRYRVLSKLGQGGFGAVYLAHDDQLDREVAIKVASETRDESATEEFLQEARRLANLKHPSILTVYDVGVEAGQCYIVADYLDGNELSSWMKKHRPDWQQSARMVSSLADALAHAHEKSTVHRDIKPENVIVVGDGHPVLVDFGLALADDDETESWRGAVAGTPAYMSPEQTQGRAHTIDGRTDIYSLGVVLYRMLCGRRPFRAEKLNALLRQIQEDEPQPPRQLVPALPEELERICLRAMAKAPGDRYSTAGDFARDLRELLGIEPPATSQAAAVQTLPRQETSESVSVQNEGESEAGSSSLISETPSMRRQREAERRQVTLLYCTCELLDEDEAPAELDPEEQSDVLAEWRKACDEVVGRFDGTPIPSAGEELLICFGYPIGFEDSAQRAVRTGLGIVDGSEKLNERLQKRYKVRADVRGAIHTGLVVVSENTDASATEVVSLVGEARNTVVKLDPLAEPGELIVTSAAWGLVQGFFEGGSLGKQSVRGVKGRLEIHRVTGESDAQTRIDADADAKRLTPLVGRDREVGLLQESWEAALEGIGQIVLLTGEAGLGKSRLVHVIREHVEDSSPSSGGSSLLPGAATTELTPVIGWRCSPYHVNTGLFPAAEYFERTLGFGREESAAAKLDRVVEYLEPFNLADLDEAVALLAGMLSIPFEDRYSLPDLSPQAMKERTLLALVDWLRDYSAQQSVLFIVEDLHWVDPSTIEFLNQVVDQCSRDCLLTLFTARPEFQSPWGNRTNVTQIALNRLRRRQIAEMMQLKTGITELPDPIVDQIVERTDGVPLFVEEFTRMVQEAGGFESVDGETRISSSFSLVGIPSTLKDLLVSRLDRMDSDQDVVQTAASLGREFTWEMIAAVWEADEATLQSELEKLIAAEMIFARGRPPRATYSFKHALIQDAAYDSMLKKKRQQVHERIASVFAERFPEIGETLPALMAHHLTEAGLTEQAIEYWLKAGTLSQQKSANDEAIAQLTRGLELVEDLDESPERDQTELGLLIPRGVVYMATLGWASNEVGDTFRRAQELCEKLGAKEHQFNVMWGIWGWRLLRGEFDECKQIAIETDALAEEVQHPAVLMEAPWIPGCTAFYRGEFAESLKHLELGFSRWDEETSKVTALATGQNCGVSYQCYIALNLWYLGFPDQALARSKKTMEVAERLKHPFSLGFALWHTSWLESLCGMTDVAKSRAEKALEISNQQSFPIWKLCSMATVGFTTHLKGDSQGGLELMQQSAGMVDFLRSLLNVPHVWHMLAQAHWKLGQFDEALAALDRESDHALKSHERYTVAELHRLRGEVLLSQSDSNRDESEQCFRDAIQVAQEQGALSWQLRAATSLARLLEATGRKTDAIEALSEVYDRFTEGFETGDLVEARSLLEELKAG